MNHSEEGLTPTMSEFEEIDRSRYVPILVGNRMFYVQAAALDEEEEVAARKFGLDDFTQSIGAVAETVSNAVMSGLCKLQPGKVIVEFGCEIGMDTGNLTAILVKGTAKANVKVTVEWAPRQQE
jgi:Trypsin-co-occurring domain 1